MGQPTVGFVCDEDDDLGLNVGAEIHLNFDQISSQIDLRNFDVILITDFFFFGNCVRSPIMYYRLLSSYWRF